MKVYLIGMPGSGKSYLGRQIADALSLPFVDLDGEIEKREGFGIPEIFSNKGEDYFRQKEAESLLEWASKNESFIMATGGGAPCFYNGIDILNSTGITIFLEVPLPTLISRLSNKSDRPLLQTESEDQLQEKLQSLMDKRLHVYRKSAITISKPSASKILEKLRIKN
jgi:shikimate kinase